MRFYKIVSKIADDCTVLTSEKEGFESFANTMQSCSRDLYVQSDKKDVVFVSQALKGNVVRLGAIIHESSDIRRVLDRFFALCALRSEKNQITEETLDSLRGSLRFADRFDFVEDDEGLAEQFGISRLLFRHNSSWYDDNIIEMKSKKQIIEEAEKGLYSESFLPEIERIYAGKKRNGPVGHPVHYFVRTCREDTRRELCRSLISALYENGRIVNQRYAYVDFYTSDMDFDEEVYDALYKSCEGGAMIVRYHNDGAGVSHGPFAGRGLSFVDNVCAVAKRYRNSVQTIFWTEMDSVKTRDLFLANLTSVPIVEITDDKASAERAKFYLKEQAKAHAIRSDAKLFKNLKDGESYGSEELRRWFDEWYTEKLQTVVYDQYKDIKTATVEIVKEDPKGNAAAELKEMIGLDAAKEVIANAVNFFKMQKLYEERGLSANRPSMHMVFTGNPGTAKTTVARLFARIMKDNGLLTKGDLYEVGRADIVGQYVGSTAPLVKKHFKRAKGSVLFIDEAYSLVDDRDGLFGDEAINTIVQEMENNRDDLVVIFAGYPDKMEGFLNKNPGLRSRIAFHVNFDDYNTEELLDIADLMIQKTGFEFDDEAHEEMNRVFNEARQKSDFGNGRYVRNLIELSALKQASRLAKADLQSLTDADMKRITKADIAAPLISRDDGRQSRIGF